MENKYLIDANVFITAHRQSYPFDIAPSFWEQIVEKASDKIVIIENIHKEILKGNDELTNWYDGVCSEFTVLGVPDGEVIKAYSKIISSIIDNMQYKQSAKDEFASVADSWLCAYGLAYDYTIVTLEVFDPNIKNKIKIPNVCAEFGIKYIDLLRFMREIRMRF